MSLKDSMRRKSSIRVSIAPIASEKGVNSKDIRIRYTCESIRGRAQVCQLSKLHSVLMIRRLHKHPTTLQPMFAFIVEKTFLIIHSKIGKQDWSI